MNRRSFLAGAALAVLSPAVVLAKNKRFIFKVRTKSGSIVGNISISASSLDAAKVKLYERYPGCTVLDARES